METSTLTWVPDAESSKASATASSGRVAVTKSSALTAPDCSKSIASA